MTYDIKVWQAHQKTIERDDAGMTIKNNGKPRTKRPGALYALLGGLVALYAMVSKKQKLMSDLPDGLKPPFIIVGNHTSFFDFVYAVRAFYPVRINFVVARKYFYFSGLGRVMKLAHAIPKSLFQTDMSTIVAMFDILKQGGVVGIFPEGQISISGMTIDSGEAIAKFIKKAGVPVARILTGGAYFCNPPWAKSARKGLVESRVDLVLTTEQTRALSVDAIAEKIRQSIYIDSFAWQKSAGSVYSGKELAVGLENILYRCPRCKKHYTINTQGDMIRCIDCGSEARYGEDGHLSWTQQNSFKHIGDWHFWQMAQELSEIASDEDYDVSEPVELAMLRLNGSDTEVVGSGMFTAGREWYRYAGTLRGQDVHLVFPTAAVRSLPFDAGKNFQIYQKDLLYEFRPENPKWCMKIANICEAIYVLNEKKPVSVPLSCK